MVGNNFIAATAGHSVMTFALDNAIDAMGRGDRDSIWLSTGPALVSRSLAYYLAQHWPERTPQDFGVTVLTRAELMNYDAINGKLAYKSTKASWLIKESGKGKDIKLPGVISAKSGAV